MRKLFKTNEHVFKTFGEKYRDSKQYENMFYFGFEETTFDSQNYLNDKKKSEFDREGDIIADIYMKNVINF